MSRRPKSTPSKAIRGAGIFSTPEDGLEHTKPASAADGLRRLRIRARDDDRNRLPNPVYCSSQS